MMKRFRRLSAGTIAVTAAALLLAACGGGGSPTSSSSAPAGAKVKGGTATFAIQAGQVPNYIFPLMPLTYFSTTNISGFQYLMFRPLYWFGQGGQPVVNDSLSLAKPPAWSNGGKTVTITLKPYKWSNGKTVTAKDVQFWQDMVTANKSNWAAYVPGNYPDNVTSTKVVNSTTIQFNLTKAYNHKWFLYNELSQVTPMPMAWDVTSAGAAPGSGGCTASAPKKCVAVYNFLAGQSKDVHSYASNPLWHIVDGPWKLQQYQTTGYSVFVPNKSYSGPVKPTLSKFVEKPFTTEAAEFNSITSGNGVDVGYLPFTDAAQKPRVTSLGYNVDPWVGWQTSYFPLNFNNPTVGPIFKQLYVRQALQMVMDQPGSIKAYFHGYAVPTYGPVPIEPKNPYASSFEKSNPYPYNPAKAKKLITSHGWTIKNGVATCTSPGTGPGHCGAGVKSGARMSFNLEYESGVPAVDQMMKTYKSNAAQAGISINLSQAPFDSVISNATPCKPGPKCTWQIENWGAGWIFAPDYYPSGGEIYGTGAGSNSGSYSDPTNDANIAATHLAQPSQAHAAMVKYENYLAKQLPVIYQPTQDFQITLVNNKLHGVTPQSPLINITPANWYFTK